MLPVRLNTTDNSLKRTLIEFLYTGVKSTYVYIQLIQGAYLFLVIILVLSPATYIDGPVCANSINTIDFLDIRSQILASQSDLKSYIIHLKY